MKAQFITDFGSEQQAIDIKTGKVAYTLPRYGVWGEKDRPGKPEVIETGNDLEDLQRRYGPGLPVHRI